VVYVNQVLFTVYILRVRHGDVSFIARYMPEGWFAIAHGPGIEALARHFPAPGLLAPTVMRVDSFLELPFGVFAYLTVCHWFSPDVYRRALWLIWPASLAYTATFCLIEWQLHSPYTIDDILIRIVSGIVVPLWAARLSPEGPNRVNNLPGLLVFATRTLGLGLLVLFVYGTAMLYNLGHLRAQLPAAAVALIALAAAQYAVRWVPDHPPGRCVDSVARSFGWLLVVFFVPALPIRYGLLGFGSAYASVIGALVLITVAMAYGIREVFTRTPGRPGTWLLQMLAALTAGLGGSAVSILLPADHTETSVLWAASAFFFCAIAACALIDRLAHQPRL
jgi:hypothetical protein